MYENTTRYVRLLCFPIFYELSATTARPRRHCETLIRRRLFYSRSVHFKRGRVGASPRGRHESGVRIRPVPIGFRAHE